MKISVIIPNYNGKNLLASNLPHVLTACPDCEIIVVDDASSDDSVEFLKSHFPEIKILQNKTNQRFAKACNYGAKEARGELLIFLNSDVSPEKDFLPPLLKHFQSFDPLNKPACRQGREGRLKAGRFNDKIFSVGCREIEIKNGQESISGRTEGEIKKGLLVHWKPKDQESQNTLWTIGGSMVVSKSKFINLGGFDSIYSPAYWEDIDLCWQAKQNGWQVLFEKDSIVYHHHESTNASVFGQTKIEAVSLRNQIIFSLKHFPLRFYFWLPYHIIITNWKTKNLFIKVFIQAIRRLYLNQN